MLQADRCAKIYEIIKDKKSVTVQFLSKHLYASEATIRRDLEAMEKQNLLKRVWGGAMLPTVDRDIPPLCQRADQHSGQRKNVQNCQPFP